MRIVVAGDLMVDVVAALPDLWREWDLLHRAPPPPRPPILLELPRPLTI